MELAELRFKVSAAMATTFLQTHDSTVCVPAANLYKQNQQRATLGPCKDDTAAASSAQQLLGREHIDSSEPVKPLTARSKTLDSTGNDRAGVSATCLKGSNQIRRQRRTQGAGHRLCWMQQQRKHETKPESAATASSGVFSFLDFLCLRAPCALLHVSFCESC